MWQKTVTANVCSIYVKRLCTMRLCFSVCSVRPVLSVLLIQSSNQCLIISFTSRTFNASITYCCTDNRFVCPNVKFLLLLGNLSLSGTLFPMNITFSHKNCFSLSEIVDHHICDLSIKNLILKVIVSLFPSFSMHQYLFQKQTK